MNSRTGPETGTMRRGRDVGRTPADGKFIFVECWNPEFGRGCRQRRWAPVRSRFKTGQYRLCRECVKVNWRPYFLAIHSPEKVFGTADDRQD